METKDLKKYIQHEMTDITDKVEKNIGFHVGSYINRFVSECEKMLKWKLSLDERVRLLILEAVFDSIGDIITDENIDEFIDKLNEIAVTSNQDLFRLMVRYGIYLIDAYSQSMGFHSDHIISKPDNSFMDELYHAIMDYKPNDQLSDYEEVRSQISKWLDLVEPGTMESLVAADKVTLFKEGYDLMKNNPTVPICLKHSENNAFDSETESDLIVKNHWYVDHVKESVGYDNVQTSHLSIHRIQFDSESGSEFTSKINRVCEIIHTLLTEIENAENSPSNKHKACQKIYDAFMSETSNMLLTPKLILSWCQQCNKLMWYYSGMHYAFPEIYTLETTDARDAISPMSLTEFINTVRRVLVKLSQSDITEAQELIKRCDALWFPCTLKTIAKESVDVLVKAITFNVDDHEVSGTQANSPKPGFELPAKKIENTSVTDATIGDIHRRAIRAITENNIADATSILDEIQDVLNELSETDGPYKDRLSVLGTDQHLLQLRIKNSENRHM